MSLIQWKQIDTNLLDDGILTGSLNVTGSIFLNGISLEAAIATGDISAVYAGQGLEGGGATGDITVGLDTGSEHFQTGVLSLSAFRPTGSFFGANTDLQATGSVSISGSTTIVGSATISGSLAISENLIVDGTITAQQFYTEYISSSIIYESGSTKFGDTLDDTHEFTGSIKVSGSLTVGGVDLVDLGLFKPTGSIYSTTNDVEVTGSFSVLSSPLTSTALFSNNTTVGYPTSNQWQVGLEGSYFNNFTAETNISEILRFIAGVLSSSLDVADALPNTKTWGGVSTSYTLGSDIAKNTLLNGVLGSTYENARLSVNWTGSQFIDLALTGSYRSAQDYLENKGWIIPSDRGTDGKDTGTNPFHGTYASRIPSTILTQASFGTNTFTISANAAGSSDVYSNINYFGLGTLTNGDATPYYVQVLATQSFSDNYGDTVPDETSTFTTSSIVEYQATSFGTTSDGLILSKILTNQPAVIPSAYQDGDFNNILSPISGRKYTDGATTSTSISASGYYKFHDIVVGLRTGSQAEFTYLNGSDSSVKFYLYTGDLPSDITTGAPTVQIANQNLVRTSFAAVSRSLSGAPYILSTSYNFTYSTEVSRSFDPGFGYNSTPLSISNPTNTWENIGSTSLTNNTVSVTNTGVQTSITSVRGVLSSDKTIQRSAGNIPNISDIAFASSSFTFSLDSNTTNTTLLRSNQESTNYNLTFRTSGTNWKNSSQTSTTSTVPLYDSTLFGQSSNSGSMAVYSRSQGYDAGSLGGTTELFSGEDFRIKVNDNVISFNGDSFTTDAFATNDQGSEVLGNYDLQVKPGYLVDPGGVYGYWFASGFGTGTYKYYIRKFQTSGTKTSMAINLGKSLVNWKSTSNGIAAAILFKSSGAGSGVNNSLATARIYDPTETTSNLVEASISQDYFKNPFSTAIDLYGNTGGSISSTTYTMPLRNIDGMYLDNSDNQYYLIIRYKGDPSPVTSITITTS